MDLIIIELICWGGLLFFFWALKDGLGRVESEIESMGLIQNLRKVSPGQQSLRYYNPETVREPIGSYRGETIYRYVMIDGRTYQFDRVFPAESTACVATDERCVAPGLVYLEYDNCPQPLARI